MIFAAIAGQGLRIATTAAGGAYFGNSIGSNRNLSAVYSDLVGKNVSKNVPFSVAASFATTFFFGVAQALATGLLRNRVQWSALRLVGELLVHTGVGAIASTALKVALTTIFKDSKEASTGSSSRRQPSLPIPPQVNTTSTTDLPPSDGGTT